MYQQTVLTEKKTKITVAGTGKQVVKVSRSARCRKIIHQTAMGLNLNHFKRNQVCAKYNENKKCCTRKVKEK